MYIRKVTIQNKKTGKSYFTYKIVESIKTPKGPRQRVLLNLGVDFSVSKEGWKELCCCIESKLSDKLHLVPFSAEVERRADTLVSQILQQESKLIIQ